MSKENIKLEPEQVSQTHPLTQVVAEVEKVFVGKTEVIQFVLAALLAQGHVLLEDLPGVGKTTLAKALAKAIDCTFRRIQFTSDMLPSDIIGTSVFDQKRGEFRFEKGPIFANFILADEINRASPRTQSALLEAMNELQVTVDNVTYKLQKPFFVIATQNPKELHGTYPLPESQLDRFMICLEIGYPESQFEKQIFNSYTTIGNVDEVETVIDRAGIIGLQEQVDSVVIDDRLIDYTYQIIVSTRRSDFFEYGASPRAGIHLVKMAKALALIHQRRYVLPDDIRACVIPVLAHRLIARGHAPLSDSRHTVVSRLQDLLETIPAP